MNRLYTVLTLALLFVAQGFAGIELLENSASGDVIKVDFTLSNYALGEKSLPEGLFTTVSSDEMAAVTLEKGAPELPYTATALMVPAGSTPEVTVENAVYDEIALETVLPSRGNILRVNIDKVPYELGAAYSADALFPAANAAVGDAYVVSGVSGVALRLYPFQYNPVKKVLRVLKSATITVTAEGGESRAVATGVDTDRFLNGKSALRYTPVYDGDRMIVITASKHKEAIQPLVDWKNRKGIETTVHVYGDDVSGSVSGLESFIKEKYQSEDVNYVLIVGDWEDIPSPMKTLGSETVSCDPTLVMLDGSDLYPDAFIGRISASSTSDVENYVDKLLKYEMEPTAGADWYKKSVGIGSSEGSPKDYDWIEDSIFTELSSYGYTTNDKVFEGVSGSANDISSYINQGRGLVNFMGHGNNNGFGFSSGLWYSSSYVKALTNAEKLPVVIPLACNIGQFKGRTCVSEDWIRNANGGAIVIMGSSPLMDWTPPQYAQVEMNRLITKDTHLSMGAMFFNGSMRMMDVSGSGGNKTMQSWNYFGDPTLQFFSKSPSAMTVSHDENFTAGSNTLDVSGPAGAIVCVYSATDGILAVKEISGSSASLSFDAGDDAELFVTVTAKNKVPYLGTITAGQSDPYVTVKAPNGGEVLSLGEATTITWSDNVDDKATVELHKDGSKVATLASDVDGNSYEWTLADEEIGGGYTIVVKCGSLEDESDASFEIKKSSWSENLTLVTMWDDNSDTYEGENGSSVEMTKGRPGNVKAKFNIGKMDSGNDIYPWATVSAYLANNLEGVSAVKVKYKSDKKLLLTFDQEGLMDKGTSYGVELAATNGEWVETIVENSEFKQPSWVGSSDKADLDLTKVTAISFAPVGYEIEANVEFEDVRLRDYQGDYVALVDYNSKVVSSDAITIAGISQEGVALAIPTSGRYSVSLYTVSGRQLMTEALNLERGVNTLSLEHSGASQVYLIAVEGMGKAFMNKVVLQ